MLLGLRRMARDLNLLDFGITVRDQVTPLISVSRSLVILNGMTILETEVGAEVLLGWPLMLLLNTKSSLLTVLLRILVSLPLLLIVTVQAQMDPTMLDMANLILKFGTGCSSRDDETHEEQTRGTVS